MIGLSLASSPKCLWLLGLSGAGKTTLARELGRVLEARGERVMQLDGDVLRLGLNSDLGFTDADRYENVRRTAEVARLFLGQGYWVVVALITPFADMHAQNRDLLGDAYVEIFVDTPLEICQERDPKGLYAKAERGEISDFTGLDSPFDVPHDPHLRVPTDGSVAISTDFILGALGLSALSSV